MGSGSKSGGYGGGFLQLFDWNAKSRRKLFSSKSDLSEHSNHGKKCEGNLPMRRIHVIEEEEFGTGLSIRGGSDCSCASSITDEDGYGTKPPGVVARLMGLDSLPTSNPSEPNSTPFFDTKSFRDAPFRPRNIDFNHDHQIIHSSPPVDKVEDRHQKMTNRPFEKFQTEILPPKSAKTIPITHHRLLSPIKSPTFVPSQDTAHVMEVAAKIFEPGTRATPRAKISSSGSSSFTFQVRELKEKLEATQKPFKAEPSRGKSISLAIQAKVNVQKREGFILGSKSLQGLEEQRETASTQSSKSQTIGPKITNKNSSTQRTSSSVLRQNNQKQNCSMSSVTTSTSQKPVSRKTSHGRQRSSRKSNLRSRDGDKEVTCSGVRNVPRKKRSVECNLHKHDKPSQTSTVVDRQFSWIEESRRKGMDVVSFTFTSPINRSLTGLESSEELVGKKSKNCTEDRSKKLLSSDITRTSSRGLTVTEGDALSILLERKLKELNSNLETSQNNIVQMGIISMESSRQSVITGSAEQLGINDMNSQVYSSLSPAKPEQARRKYNFQEMEAMDEHSSNKAETKEWNNNHLPSPVSTLEPSTLTESCYSSESIPSCTIEVILKSNQCSSIHAREVLGSSYLQKFRTVETEGYETDISDFMDATTWELGYIKDILGNIELMFRDYVTGRTREIVNPHLFDQMERRRVGVLTREDKSRLRRKVLFDCVSECLNLKCRRFVGGGFEMWAKGIAMLRRKERLTEEVYKEIQGWRSLGNRGVDELVDKDMSSKYGRWLDFEVDEFILGVEIEGQILDSLVLEVVANILEQ